MSFVISPGVAGAIAGELLNASIRFYFLWKRMQVLQGMTDEQVDARYAEVKAEFDKNPPEALQKMVEELGL